jgi:hypothetical protein
MDDALRQAKLTKLIEIEGYDSADELMEAVFSDAVSPAICMNEGCDYTCEVELGLHADCSGDSASMDGTTVLTVELSFLFFLREKCLPPSYLHQNGCETWRVPKRNRQAPIKEMRRRPIRIFLTALRLHLCRHRLRQSRRRHLHWRHGNLHLRQQRQPADIQSSWQCHLHLHLGYAQSHDPECGEWYDHHLRLRHQR